MRKEIFEKINKEIKLNYNSSSELAKELGITRQGLVLLLKRLKNGEGITLKSLEKLCEKLGYEITLKKKKSKN